MQTRKYQLRQRPVRQLSQKDRLDPATYSAKERPFQPLDQPVVVHLRCRRPPANPAYVLRAIGITQASRPNPNHQQPIVPACIFHLRISHRVFTKHLLVYRQPLLPRKLIYFGIFNSISTIRVLPGSAKNQDQTSSGHNPTRVSITNSTQSNIRRLRFTSRCTGSEANYVLNIFYIKMNVCLFVCLYQYC